MKITVLSGANLNNLGKRKAIYGSITYAELCDTVRVYSAKKGIKVEFVQSNYEGALIEEIQKCCSDGLIINAGAFAHYSYAIRDAVEDINIPVVEVHLTDIMNREEFRRTRVLKDVAEECFMGEGVYSYFKAIDYFSSKGKPF